MFSVLNTSLFPTCSASCIFSLKAISSSRLPSSFQQLQGDLEPSVLTLCCPPCPAAQQQGKKCQQIQGRAAPSKQHHTKATKLSASRRNNLTFVDHEEENPRATLTYSVLYCMPQTQAGSAVDAAFSVLFSWVYKPSSPSTGLDNASMLKNNLAATRIKAGGNIWMFVRTKQMYLVTWQQRIKSVEEQKVRGDLISFCPLLADISFLAWLSLSV